MNGATLSADRRDQYQLDTEYIGDLSADAIPIIVRRLNNLSPPNQTQLRQFLSKRAEEFERRPARTWTFGLYNARASLVRLNATPDKP